jgi:hypothetical protein
MKICRAAVSVWPPPSKNSKLFRVIIARSGFYKPAPKGIVNRLGDNDTTYDFFPRLVKHSKLGICRQSAELTHSILVSQFLTFASEIPNRDFTCSAFIVLQNTISHQNVQISQSLLCLWE